jgi:hypothetical protein
MMTRMRSILVLLAATATAAAIAGTASAASGGGATKPAPTPFTTGVTITADPGTAITTDPTKAPAGARLAPSPGSTCATCGGGGGPVQGCAQASTGGGDGYGNSVHSYYHWCWLNGSISSNYGWGDESACWGFCNFLGWNYNFDFGNGHQDKATFRDASVSVIGIGVHYDTTASSCVAVDGWGNAWGC